MRVPKIRLRNSNTCAPSPNYAIAPSHSVPARATLVVGPETACSGLSRLPQYCRPLGGFCKPLSGYFSTGGVRARWLLKWPRERERMRGRFIPAPSNALGASRVSSFAAARRLRCPRNRCRRAFAVVIADDEALCFHLLDGPRRREAARGLP